MTMLQNNQSLPSAHGASTSALLQNTMRHTGGKVLNGGPPRRHRPALTRVLCRGRPAVLGRTEPGHCQGASARQAPLLTQISPHPPVVCRGCDCDSVTSELGQEIDWSAVCSEL